MPIPILSSISSTKVHYFCYKIILLAFVTHHRSPRRSPDFIVILHFCFCLDSISAISSPVDHFNPPFYVKFKVKIQITFITFRNEVSIAFSGSNNCFLPFWKTHRIRFAYRNDHLYSFVSSSFARLGLYHWPSRTWPKVCLRGWLLILLTRKTTTASSFVIYKFAWVSFWKIYLSNCGV